MCMYCDVTISVCVFCVSGGAGRPECEVQVLNMQKHLGNNPKL